jgi:hypothetical protein
MQARFESDMAELHGHGGYLLLCAGRGKVFMEGAAENGVPLAEVSTLSAADGAIVVHAEGRDIGCPFPEATAADLAPHVARLNESLAAWR